MSAVDASAPTDFEKVGVSSHMKLHKNDAENNTNLVIPRQKLI